ncbi:MAG: hypothetical protein ACI83H_000518 [Glaciecola sp.]|jgi:hypothetical protein
MKKLFIAFILLIFAFSCRNKGLDIHFNDKDAKMVLNTQCSFMPEELCEKFKEEYKQTLGMQAVGSRAEAFAITRYEKLLVNVTLQDILDYTLEKNK